MKIKNKLLVLVIILLALVPTFSTAAMNMLEASKMMDQLDELDRLDQLEKVSKVPSVTTAPVTAAPTVAVEGTATVGGQGTTAATSVADNPALEKVRNLTNNSLGILVMSAIGTTYSKMLYDGAAEQEQEAKANIVKIDKLIQTFKDSYANFCPTGRESLNEPKCYCYLESGKQNPDRTKSQTCIDLWAKGDYKLAATAGNYSGVSTFVDAAGCVNLNGKFDENCTCKKFVDAKGGNACMKTTNITIPTGLGSGFATGSALKQVTTFSNNSANGNPKFDSMSESSLKANAIEARKLAQNIYSKLAPQLPPNIANLLKVDERNVGRLAASVLGQKGMQAAMNGPSSAIGYAGSRETDAQTASLLKQAAKSAGLVEISGSGRGLSNKKADEKDGMNFSFLGDAAAAGTSQTQNFPESQKNYNFKDNDISKKSDISIFEIISNRYMQSGLKRLFDN